jgi:hypothetical protein
MSGTIFTDANRIVRENVDHRELGQRGQTDGRTTVVSEYQKCRSGRPENSVIGDTVEDRAHPVLTDSKPDIPS